MKETAYFPLSEIFAEIRLGDIHASSKLEEGDIPLISCATDNNGTEGYFKISKDKTYENCVTIACDGSWPLTSFYHPYMIAAKDNVLICIPKKEIKLTTIYYAVAYLNTITWRFSYGRKCYASKSKKIKINFPVKDNGKIDEEYIEEIIKVETDKITPQKNETKPLPKEIPTFKPYRIDSLFNLERGDFHAISKLNKGTYPTVSRIDSNNGVVGYYELPKKAKIYPKGFITVSTVSGISFLQAHDFIATDNVVICIPKKKFNIATLIFIQYMINREKWRYSYGRQCYKTKFAKTQIYLPINEDNHIDEIFIQKIVKNTSYWNYLMDNLRITPVFKGQRTLQDF